MAELAADRAPAGQGGSPDVSKWPIQNQLLASISDHLAIANWQRGSGKGKKPTLLTDSKARRRAKPAKTAVDTFGAAAVREALDRLGGAQR